MSQQSLKTTVRRSHHFRIFAGYAGIWAILYLSGIVLTSALCALGCDDTGGIDSDASQKEKGGVGPDNEDTDTGTDGQSTVPVATETICQKGSGPVAECQTELCIDDVIHISVTENAAGEGLMCTGWAGSETCTGNDDYQAFAYDGDDVFLVFSFAPEIAGNYSEENFRDLFDHVWLNIYFPGYDKRFYHQVSTTSDLNYFDSFKYSEGRLKGRIDTTINAQLQSVQSSDENCISDDIMGKCACGYNIPVRVVIDFDLAVES
ncbi:MAG: hypothetical protein JXR76_14180 [Deltaproteobacteria bacterium]|nr:hypothetical protein [Deltaproteobacteria bacterium]